jgi:hypothetical protein
MTESADHVPVTRQSSRQPWDEAALRARVRHTRVVLEWLREQQEQLAVARDNAILELTAAGITYDVISQECGLTRGRISQIVAREQARTGQNGAAAATKSRVRRTNGSRPSAG